MFETDFAPQHPGLQNVPIHVITFDDPVSAPLMEIVAEVGGGSFHYAARIVVFRAIRSDQFRPNRWASAANSSASTGPTAATTSI